MDNFTEHFKESLQDRADNIVNEIATTNPKYKEFSKEIQQLEDALIKLLPEDKFTLFDDYRDFVLQQESLVNELLYLQGFMDGAELKKLYSENIG
jgi:hypothetical protein